MTAKKYSGDEGMPDASLKNAPGFFLALTGPIQSSHVEFTPLRVLRMEQDMHRHIPETRCQGRGNRTVEKASVEG